MTSPTKQWLHEQYTRLTREIQQERIRQVGEEGYTREHDAGKGKQLRQAAKCYQRQALAVDYKAGHLLTPADLAAAGELWPWRAEFWKPSLEVDRNLVKAGALMMAAVDADAAEVA